MANNFVTDIPEDLDLKAKAEELASLYRGKGYTANVTVAKEKTAIIVIEKGCGGINSLLGLGEGITVNLNKQGTDMLTVSFSNAEWTSKIIGFCVGWFLCLIPIITALIGTMKQTSLPKNIESDMRSVLCS